jgi:hypothetical protein
LGERRFSREAQGTRRALPPGALLFGNFLLGEQEKVTRAIGAEQLSGKDKKSIFS